jgi:cytochrome c-type biogenesis protein CcmH
MTAKKFLFEAGLALVASLLLAGLVSAQQPQPTPSDDQVNAIASQLYCPVCENTPLDVCPTTACAQWRELIRQKLIEGKSPQEIKDYFVEYYGARVLGAPPAAGFYWLAYVVPPIIILAGAYVLVRAFLSWKKNAPPPEKLATSPPPPAIQPPERDEYIQRLEDEVHKG